MTVDGPETIDKGAGAVALALDVVDMGAWPAEPDFPDLPILAPAPVPVADVAVLGDILADSLFGDVIEMSELIPHLFEGQAGAADGCAFQKFAAVPEPVADASAAVLPFNIFFDEDGSSGHGTT